MDYPSSFCIDCHSTVSAFEEAIQCDTCHLWQHRVCNSGINREDYRRAVSGKIELSWNCGQCSWGPDASNVEESIVSNIENNKQSETPKKLKFEGNHSQTSNSGKRFSDAMQDVGATSVKFNQSKKFKQEFPTPTATYDNVSINDEASFSGFPDKSESSNAKTVKLKSYVCQLCDNEFKGVKALIAHVSEDHSEDPAPEAPAPVAPKIKKEAVSPSKEGETKKSWSLLKKESLPVNLPDTEEGEFLKNQLHTCGVCDLVFLRHDILMDHLKVHTNILPITCHLCNEVFCSKHESTSLIYPNKTIGDLYHCNMCDKNFSRKDSLRKHLRSHTGERPYSCDICKKTFTRRDCRAVHMKVHFKVKAYPCELCGESFSNRQPLIDHIKSHIVAYTDNS